MEAKDPVASLNASFPGAVQEVVEFRGETTLYIDPPQLATVAQYLRDEPGLGYNLLLSVTGVDYLPETPRFAVAYGLYALLTNRRLRLKVRLEEDDPRVPSVTPLWPTANWQEREAAEMFGITFEGHPDPRHLLLPDDWDGYPQRKDYPLGYETVQFSFNFDEIQKHKPFAKE